MWNSFPMTPGYYDYGDSLGKLKSIRSIFEFPKNTILIGTLNQYWNIMTILENNNNIET